MSKEVQEQLEAAGIIPVLRARSAKEALGVVEAMVAGGVTVIAETKKRDKVSLPGALTPTEVITAWRAGADFVKVFPCSAMGGASYLKSLKAPFPYLRLVPTGGVTLQTAASFLEAGASALGVGADLVNL